MCFIAGYLISTIRVSNISYSDIPYALKNIEIEGVISKIKPTPFGSQITIIQVKSILCKEMEGVRSIRLNLPHFSNSLLHGDRIKTICDLYPPPEQLLPNSYNFKKIAFFSGIGAIGKVKSSVQIIEHNKNYRHYFQSVRKSLYGALINTIGSKSGSFAAALFLGETGGIERTILNNMRYAGVSHILCVSGLHLSLVTSIVFLCCRVILNCSDYISHNIDIKKLSAFISILVSFGYLILTGMQIAAFRAFIMVLFVMVSVIVSKQPHPMRSLCLACVALLTKNPEYAILPSFQLSFIAVMSLLCGFEYFNTQQCFTGIKGSIFNNIKLYFLSNIYSSVLASIATAPIVMYHFYLYSNYSLLANLIAVPLVGFIIMPAGMIAIVLSPSGLSFIPLYLVSISIDIIKYVADIVTNLPFAIIYTGYISNIGICAFILGFFWLCIWQSKVRFYGVLGFVVFITVFLPEEKPSIIVNKKANFVVQNKGDKILIYTNKISFFAKNFTANWYGQKNAYIIKRNMSKPLKLSLMHQDHKNNFIRIQLSESIIHDAYSSYSIKDMSLIYINEGRIRHIKNIR